MDETFGMYPAQCVCADAKLTRVDNARPTYFSTGGPGAWPKRSAASASRGWCTVKMGYLLMMASSLAWR
jgi:hypothetical protein